MDHDRPGTPSGSPVRALTTGQTILLVEDDAAVRGFVGDLLPDEGYAIIEIPEGAGPSRRSTLTARLRDPSRW